MILAEIEAIPYPWREPTPGPLGFGLEPPTSFATVLARRTPPPQLIASDAMDVDPLAQPLDPETIEVLDRLVQNAAEREAARVCRGERVCGRERLVGCGLEDLGELVAGEVVEGGGEEGGGVDFAGEVYYFL